MSAMNRDSAIRLVDGITEAMKQINDVLTYTYWQRKNGEITETKAADIIDGTDAALYALVGECRESNVKIAID